ncbi:unnamed protein product [Acanthoscelides obtectus]|uniref:Transposase Tc1-like domain-containing protein n=1 Tax=Acanthoscelides obtectus TaxID=200917 RepID=A0A9P0PJC9_ACAOB|nr:unnamed protein product [Acanthoscelides obtectus]CAK1676322.1 hypothetical protein AOBTE_LOCUS30692 [Acanthoscelides obtectus]
MLANSCMLTYVGCAAAILDTCCCVNGDGFLFGSSAADGSTRTPCTPAIFAAGIEVSQRTVQRRLAEEGLIGRRPARKPRLTPAMISSDTNGHEDTRISRLITGGTFLSVE